MHSRAIAQELSSRIARRAESDGLTAATVVLMRTFWTKDGVAVAAHDLGGRGPTLLMVHATGFAGQVLAPLAKHLAERFRCIAIDSRAHGFSAKPPDGDLGWHGFADDIAAVIDGMSLESPYGFGHSSGGAALLLAEEAIPGTFQGLYCYEPVMIPSEVPLAVSLDNNPLSAGALRRRAIFPSRAEALANFSTKAPFCKLDPEVLRAYIQHGFVEVPGSDGSVQLRCAREDEAAIYANGLAHDAFTHLGKISCRVVLACGENTDAFGPELIKIFANRISRSSIVIFPGLSHFGPLEDPQAVAFSVIGELQPPPSSPGPKRKALGQEAR